MLPVDKRVLEPEKMVIIILVKFGVELYYWLTFRHYNE